MTTTTHRNQPAHKLIVFTDLDGTLLDQQTYSYKGSSAGILRLKSLKIPLILCSSKTLGEVFPLCQALGLQDPFIVENGGAICLPQNYFSFPVEGTVHRESLEILALGDEISYLQEALADAASGCAVRVKSFCTMSPEEIASLTGLSRADSLLAAKREYDEPFIVEEGSREKLYSHLRGKGFHVTEGDRFSHLTGSHDKGRAVSMLTVLYRRKGTPILSVGLGNSANDVPLLKQVDRPVVVRNPDGNWDAQVLKEIPTVRQTEGIGPEGWNEAIQNILDQMD